MLRNQTRRTSAITTTSLSAQRLGVVVMAGQGAGCYAQLNGPSSVWPVESSTRRHGMKGLYSTRAFNRRELLFSDEPLVSVLADDGGAAGPTCGGCNRLLSCVGPRPPPPASRPVSDADWAAEVGSRAGAVGNDDARIAGGSAVVRCACGLPFCSRSCERRSGGAFHKVECRRSSPYPQYAALLGDLTRELQDLSSRAVLALPQGKLLLRIISCGVAEHHRSRRCLRAIFDAGLGAFVGDAMVGTAAREKLVQQALQHHVFTPLSRVEPFRGDGTFSFDTLWHLLKVVLTNACMFSSSPLDGGTAALGLSGSARAGRTATSSGTAAEGGIVAWCVRRARATRRAVR